MLFSMLDLGRIVTAGALFGAFGCSAPASRPAPVARGSTAPAPAPSPSELGSFSEVALRRDVEWLCAPERRGRGSGQPGGAATAAWLEGRFAELGLEVVRQQIAPGVDSVFGIKRSGPKAVIVSAHYDHLGEDAEGIVYPGADDNASGVAVLLAIAGQARVHEFEHTVIFAAFGAEEAGLQGSGAYVRAPLWPLEDTRAIINFDMVGRDFFEAGAAKPATAAVVGLEQEPEVRTAALSTAHREGLALVTAPARLVELFGYDDRTDEWWFRRRGILAIHFSTGMHRDYHRPTDTADKLVYPQMARIGRTAAGILAFVARAAPPREWDSGASPERTRTRRTDADSALARRR